MFKWPWVSRAKAEAKFDKMEKFYMALGDKYVQQVDDWIDEKRTLKGEIHDTKKALDTANTRLAKIAAMETPNCASIGKRMAAVARSTDQ